MTTARRFARRPEARARQRGQVLIWFLATLATSAAVLYGVYNVGQITAAKQQTTNAADAAALAGAVVQARALNYMAYTNRAVIANEAFVAQVLSLESWIFYLQRTSENLGTVTQFIPYVGQVLGPVLKNIAKVAEQVGNAVDKSEDAMVKVLEVFKTLHLAATTGSTNVAYLAGAAIAQDAASKVVAANKTVFGGRADTAPTIPGAMTALTFAKNELAWTKFTKRYAGNDRGNAKDVLLASRDGFTTDRPGNFFTNFPLLLVGLEKHGGTQLKGYDRWEAQDTLELWEWTPKGRQYQPIGWGRATLADKSSNTGTVTEPGGKHGHNLMRSALSSSTKGHGGWSGVPSFRDLNLGAKPDQKTLESLGVDFMVVTAKSGAAVPTTQTFGFAPTHLNVNVGAADMNANLLKDQVTAIGKARVYFERPQRNAADWTGTALFRGDSAKEYGSLYSPYWQARLTAASLLDKEAVAAAMGGAGVTTVPFTP